MSTSEELEVLIDVVVTTHGPLTIHDLEERIFEMRPEWNGDSGPWFGPAEQRLLDCGRIKVTECWCRIGSLAPHGNRCVVEAVS